MSPTPADSVAPPRHRGRYASSARLAGERREHASLTGKLIRDGYTIHAPTNPTKIQGTAGMNLSETSDQLRTLRDFIRWGASRFQEKRLFFGHGTDNALDEAAHLTLHALHLPYTLPDHYLDARLTGSEIRKVLNLLERRVVERKPAAYLTREAWFAGLPFYVDERVLIPRSPIAELIDNHIQPWLTREPQHILDLCTGSGCIGVALAHAFPEARVDATDIEPGPLEVAQRNVREHGLEKRMTVIESDLFDALGEDRRYDLIVANPPYVPSASMNRLPKEYRAEPNTALDGGESGLELILPLLCDAADYLTPDGLLIVEAGEAQPHLAKVLGDMELTWLEFEHGGEGVFLMTGEQAKERQARFTQAADAMGLE